MADVFTACSDFYLLFEKEREKMRDGGGACCVPIMKVLLIDVKTKKEAKHRNKTANKTRKQFKCFAIM